MTGFSKQPIRTRYLGHVTNYQPIFRLDPAMYSNSRSDLLMDTLDEVETNRTTTEIILLVTVHLVFSILGVLR